MTQPGIIVALAVEFAALGDCRSMAIRSGAGVGRAREASLRLVAQGVPCLINFGLAAGLAPDLEPGALILPENIVDTAGALHRTDSAWRARLTAAIDPAMAVRHGTVITTPTALTSLSEKQDLFRESGALAADMESSAVARVADEAAIPFLIVRAIADPAGRTVPRAALAAIGPNGATRPMAALAALIRRPAEFTAMLAVARDGRRGLDGLRGVALRCGPGFAFD